MARRPYLENERFWTLPDAALHYIMRDAHAAAKAMRGHDERAEGKYLDEMNDAMTVLAYRRKH